ncbi:UNVERIFIED_CONTAM: movement protein [Sesamum calycinum]|uniref:Movement protein n=1 Tax=Sesamum calycinum TaxID=2727403 RepID=A0AAW2JCD2_9LAMI
MDLQLSQNNYNEGDRLQTFESLSGFFSSLTVSNKTMKRIMRQDFNRSPYDGFRIGGIGKVLNQIGLNQRKHHIIYKVSSGEFAIPMEFTGNVMDMQLIPKEEIFEELSRLKEDIAVTIKWIHIGTIEVVIKATFKEGIDSEIHLSIMDRRINNLRDDCLGTNDRNYELINSDSFYEESEEEIKNLKEALQELKTMDISEKNKLSLENVKRLIQRKFSKNPLAWWDRNKIEVTLKIKEECKYEYVRYKPIQMNTKDKKDMQMIIKEHINLELIEPGISAYSSPSFPVRNHGEIKRGIFIKDLAKYRKDFRPLLKEIESAKWHLRENLEELNKKFGRLAVNAQVAEIQRADLDTVQIAIRTTIVRVQTSDDSSQPSASGVKEEEISLRPMTSTSKANTNELASSSSSSSAWQVYHRMWEKLISRKGVNPSKTIIETFRKYNRVWMLEGSKPEEVREWYEFGALASVHTMSPSFPKISKLPEWISGAVYDSWKNNPHLKRGDILELKFISAAPETVGKGLHSTFHFIKLQRPDMVAFNRIKVASKEAPLVSAISEDDISTRRAWDLWSVSLKWTESSIHSKSSPTM